MRWHRLWPLVAAVLIGLALLKLFEPQSFPSSAAGQHDAKPLDDSVSSSAEPELDSPPPPPPTQLLSDPQTSDYLSIHPARQLVLDAETKFEAVQRRQSKTLAEAVRQYQTRYGLNPPPNFDKWFEFAKKRGVQIVDEYDTVMDNLLPYWALSPSAIRSRVREALGYDGNGLIALLIRDGSIVKLEGAPEWQQRVMRDMLESFVEMLPDMDLAFNIHDEPRVVVPHDELSRMVSFAKDKALPAALSTTQPRNAFSPPPEDLDDATRRIKEVRYSRFNEYAHQATWVPSRLSCSPDSPARDYREDAQDDTAAYATDDAMGFIYNHTALSDICNTASLRTSFGFFQRPNAFKIAHELIPVFSQSKVSSFQDILYPSPWYHYGKTVTDQPLEAHQLQYNETRDMDWEEKNTAFWWRGSTTGGFSRDGGWRNQHRQQFVQNLVMQKTADVLVNDGTESEPHWTTGVVERDDFKDLFDIHFSGVGQCDPGDCDAQREYFDMAKPVDPQKAWNYKFLLDIDGNAFSGRFYSFLRSKSLPLKMSIFREWHEEWLAPWVHYIPLSLKGGEHFELVRYLAQEEEGQKIAKHMALQSTEWASKALRNADLEAWFFRLLLEYGRLVDDNRDSIGFVMNGG